MTIAQLKPVTVAPRRPGNPATLACTVAQTAVEVVLGSDTLDTLNRWVSPSVRSSLAQQHSLAARAGLNGRHNVQVRRARVCRLSPKRAEVAVVVDDGNRTRAVAMQLDALATRWVVTTLLIG